MKKVCSVQIGVKLLDQCPDRTEVKRRSMKVESTSKLYSIKMDIDMELHNALHHSLMSLNKYFQDIEEKITTHFGCSHLKNRAMSENSGHLPTLHQIYGKVLNEIQNCLPSTDVYIGEYERLTQTSTPRVVYVATSPKSKMLHRTLITKNKTTATFQAILSRDAVIIHDIASSVIPLYHFDKESCTGAFACFPLLDTPSDRNSLTSGVLCLDTCRVSGRSHPQAMSPLGLHDFLKGYMHLSLVAKELLKLEMTGERLLQLSHSQLRHLLEFNGVSNEDRIKLHSFVQSVHKGSPIINLVPSSRQTLQFQKKYASLFQGEKVLEYLHEVAASLGSCLKRYRRYHWLHRMANYQDAGDANAPSTNDAGLGHSMIYEVYHESIRAISKALLAAEKISIWRIHKSKEQEIHLLAELQVPMDRLLPFLHSDEREMRRVILYKFSQIPVDELHGKQDQTQIDLQPLIQGHVVKFHTYTSREYAVSLQIKTSGDTPESIRPHKKALYTVNWKDGTSDVLSWQKLLYLLSVRPMNPCHVQLQVLSREVRESLNGYNARTSAENERIMIKLENINSIVLILDVASADWIFCMQVGLECSYHVVHEDEEFLARIQAATISNIQWVCEFDCFHHRLKLSSDRMNQTREFLYSGVFKAVDQNSLGIVRKVWHDTRCAFPGLSLQVFALKRGKFETALDSACLDEPAAIRIYDASELPALSDRILAKKIILIENPDRIIHELAKMARRNGSSTWDTNAHNISCCPCIIIPLYYQDSAVGVMVVSSISKIMKKITKASYNYFETAAEVVSFSIYSWRIATMLHQLESNVLKEITTPHQIFFFCMEAIRDNIPGMPKVQLLSIAPSSSNASLVYQFSNVERSLISNPQESDSSYFYKIEPLSFRADDLSDKSIATHFDIPMEQIPKYRIAARRFSYSTYPIKFLSIDECGTTCSNVKTPSIRLGSLEIVKTYFTPPSIPFHRSVESIVIRNGQEHQDEKDMTSLALKAFFGTTRPYLSTLISDMGLPLYSMNIPMELNSNAEAQLKTEAIKLYLTCTATHMGTNEQVVLDQIGGILSQSFHIFRVRENRSRLRVQCVKEFSKFCENLVSKFSANTPAKITPSKELENDILLEAQEKLISLLGDTMAGANAYIGMYQPLYKRLYYTCASNTSSMRGKYLSHAEGISFTAYSQGKVLIVRREDISSDEMMLKKFGGRVHFFDLNQKRALDLNMWPCVVVPIGRYGILSMDSVMVHAISSADMTSPELGIVDSLTSMAKTLEEAIAITREVTASWRKESLNVSLTQIRTLSDVMLKLPVARINSQIPSVSAHVFSRSKQTSSSVSSFLQRAIGSLEGAICGINACIGLVQPLCEKIIFTGATKSNNMVNKFVTTHDSVYFKTFLSTTTNMVFFSDDLTAKQNEIGSNETCGSKKCDTSDEKQESRTNFNSLSQSRGRKRALFCTPIPSLGVLAVDTFAGAAGNWFGTEDCCPEREVTESLRMMGNLIANTIRSTYSQEALGIMEALMKANSTTCHDLFRNIVSILSQNLFALTEIRAVRVALKNFADSADTTTSTGVEELAYMGNKSAGGCTKDYMVTCAIIQEAHQYFDAKRNDTANAHSEWDADKSRKRGLKEVPLIMLPCEKDDMHILFFDQIYGVENAEIHPCATMIILRHAKDKVIKRTSSGTTDEGNDVFWLDQLDFIRQIHRGTNVLIKQLNDRIERGVKQQRVRIMFQQIEINMESVPASSALKQLASAHLDNMLEAMSLALNCVEGPAHLFVVECDLNRDMAQIVATSSKRSTMRHHMLTLGPRDSNLEPDAPLDRRRRMGKIILDCVTSGKLLLSEVDDDCISIPDRRTIRRIKTDSESRNTFLAVPMGFIRVLCIENLALSSGPIPKRSDLREGARKYLEKSVRVFIKFCADLLDRIISVNRLRYSYEELLACMHQTHEITLREYFGLLMSILNRDLTGVQSQQIMFLGDDFVSDYRVVCWQHSPLPRSTGGLIQHYCYLEGCDSNYLSANQNIHFENKLFLPMSNLPRTLDHCRSESGKPAHGIEKRGNFSLACMTLMLDSTISVEPKIVLCIYQTSDQYHNWRHRNYFQAFGAIACHVYAHLYPSWTLKTYSLELYCRLEQEMNLLRWISSDHRYQHGQNEAHTSSITGSVLSFDTEIGSNIVNAQVVYSSKRKAKTTLNSMTDKRLMQLHASDKNYNIYASKRFIESVLPINDIELWVDEAEQKQSSNDKYLQLRTFLKYPLHIFHHKPEKSKVCITTLPKDGKQRSKKSLPTALNWASSRGPVTNVPGLKRNLLKMKLYAYIRGSSAFGENMYESKLAKRKFIVEYVVFDGVAIECSKMAQLMDSILERTTRHANLYTKNIKKRSTGDEMCLWKSSALDFAFGEFSGSYLYMAWKECLKLLDKHMKVIETNLKIYTRKFGQAKNSTVEKNKILESLQLQEDSNHELALNCGNEPFERVVIVLLRIALLLSRSQLDCEGYAKIEEMKGAQVVSEVLRTSSLSQLRALDLMAPEVTYKKLCAKNLFFKNANAFLAPAISGGSKKSFIEFEDAVENPFYAIYHLEIVFLSIIQYLEITQTKKEAIELNFVRLVTSLQSRVRIKLSKKLLCTRRQQFNAVKKLQRLTRRHLAKNHDFQLKRTRATSTIQRAWRKSEISQNG
uniref:Uncharacterized protein AlNc14C63G4539 n=1 Tax=Albugo laibachii Nc14 TaxID=890382 RepID=F0WD16_9STRA|nr:conserved hypothetical protein [Albugo laibachii Nc14]|eukprot:CCA19088.1 conserved hypothetical protein [Albugo laibachii Nc14]